MKLQVTALAAIISLAASGVAFADGKVVATLKQPVAAKTKVVAAGAVFVCEGSTCVATVAPARTDTTKGCKALAKEVGALAAFGTLSTEDVAKCGVGRS